MCSLLGALGLVAGASPGDVGPGLGWVSTQGWMAGPWGVSIWDSRACVVRTTPACTRPPCWCWGPPGTRWEELNSFQSLESRKGGLCPSAQGFFWAGQAWDPAGPDGPCERQRPVLALCSWSAFRH